MLIDVEAFLRSGVPNTTLTNSLVNAAVHVLAFHLAGATVDDYTICVIGDDNLFFVQDSRFVAQLPKVAALLGFKIKLAHYPNPWDVRFCSQAVYPTSEGYVFGPLIGKCMMKLAYSVSSIRRGHEKSHLRGVALGLRKQVSHIPVLHEYVETLIRITEGAEHDLEFENALAEAHRKRTPLSDFHSPNEESLEHVSRMYDVPYVCVTDAQELCRNMKDPGFYGSTMADMLFVAAMLVDSAHCPRRNCACLRLDLGSRLNRQPAT